MLADRPDGLQSFEWSCPRQGCRKYILSWTQTGLDKSKQYHLEQHFKEDMQSARDRLDSAQKKFENQPPKTSNDYQKMNLTFQDVCFLKTRHISIDEDMEIEWL
jgi:hypothetical protein